MEMIPHYELAPITGENLRIVMDSCYPEPKYAKGKLTEFKTISDNLVKHLEDKQFNYPQKTMDDIERLCEVAQPYLSDFMLNSRIYNQCCFLKVILLAEYPTCHWIQIEYTRNGKAIWKKDYPAMAKRLIEMLREHK